MEKQGILPVGEPPIEQSWREFGEVVRKRFPTGDYLDEDGQVEVLHAVPAVGLRVDVLGALQHTWKSGTVMPRRLGDEE